MAMGWPERLREWIDGWRGPGWAEYTTPEYIEAYKKAFRAGYKAGQRDATPPPSFTEDPDDAMRRLNASIESAMIDAAECWPGSNYQSDVDWTKVSEAIERMKRIATEAMREALPEKAHPSGDPP